MTTTMRVIGIMATMAILIVIPIYTWLEPSVQIERDEELRTDAIVAAADLYAENCTVCHGAAGEGLAGNPALNLEALRTLSADDLAKVISRGRDNTQMAGWEVDEGGIFTSAQVDDFVTLIQHANWEYVEARVAELGLTPPEMIEFEVSQEMFDAIAGLPDAERLNEGLTVYAEGCAACHNANASGTLIAPALDDDAVRATPRQELIDVVATGVPGTLMAGWSGQLTEGDIESVVDLVLRWPEVLAAGVEFPAVEMASLPSSPERIADGQALYQIACKTCHGTDAYGTRMAPALNNAIFLSETPDAAIYQIIAGGVPGTMMPAWGGRLTDYDTQVLVAYLRSLEQQAPQIVPPILQ